MKKHFKVGIGLIIPVLLVVMVLTWLYDKISNIVIQLLPNSLDYEWWFPFIFVIIIVFLIYMLGVTFSNISLLRWAKTKIEKKIINKVPGVKGIYSFGLEIVDSFVSDVKEDGNAQVVEIEFGGLKALGVLTDEKNSLGFLLSAPSPVTGFVFKLPNYKKIDMTFLEAVKINTSLGKVGGEKWKVTK